MFQVISDEQVCAALPWRAAVEALRNGFANGSTVTVPQRHHHQMTGTQLTGDDTPTLLLMPAWNATYAGVKIVAVFPTNRDTDVATINGNYLLIDGSTGVPLALLDGGALTARRTAAASLLAATLLARPESSRLVVVGSGRLAGNLARGYATIFPIEEIAVWNHRTAGAAALAAELNADLAADGIRVTATDDLAAAVGEADLVTAATLTSDPVILGAWLRPGTHVDLVGGFTPTMREADDHAIRAADVYVDTMAGALSEAGDIVQPIASGVLSADAIGGDLFSLCGPAGAPDRSAEAVTLFKSVGHALEDLVAAATVFESVTTAASRSVGG